MDAKETLQINNYENIFFVFDVLAYFAPSRFQCFGSGLSGLGFS